MWWNERRITYYKRASESQSFHENLVNLITPMLSKDQSIYELGCGLGYVSNILNQRGYNILGVDSDIKAIEFAREYFNKDIFILDDAYYLKEKRDVAIAIFFGRITKDDNAIRLLSCVNKSLIYLQNEHAGNGDTNYEKSEEVKSFLDSRGIKYEFSKHRFSFDQMLKDENEVEEFISLNYLNHKPKLERVDSNGEYPIILKNNKAFGLFNIQKEIE